MYENKIAVRQTQGYHMTKN
uniref:Uncharacterized protein n=1 Tax=Arundo donax TaxID=35708 RepID=A0A0A8ZBZ3_ARUDO